MDRLRIFQVIIYIIAIAIILRLFYWQFISDIASSTDSLSQETILPAQRGEIYTSDNFPLVTNQEAFLLYANPNNIGSNPKDLAQKIAPLLISEKYSTDEASITPEEEDLMKKDIQNKEDEIVNKISKKNLFWVQVARKMNLGAKQKIEDFKIKGLGFEHDSKRFYPEASMAAQLLGFVGSDNSGNDTGYFGLEGYYNNDLKGKSGRIGQIQDPNGFPILVGKYRPIDPKKGSSLYLSIDRTIQFIVEQRLFRDVEKYGAKEGTVIIVDPKTGNVLAMASYPNFIPQIYSEYTQDLYKNPAVADTYEPGSTFKLIAMSAALDANLIDPNTICTVCAGPREIGGYEISTWDKKYRPNSNMTDVIVHSDNIGMTFVADKLGLDKFYDYISKFGFGKKTGIDLEGEADGTIRPKDEWRVIDLATASFGQGLAVTSTQMVQAVQAIANGGKLISPKIVKTVKGENTQQVVKPQTETQVISAKAAAQMTEMMVKAVREGEAKFAAPKGYKIAGKTGTAQIPVAGHYDPNKTIASFVGFAPADDPKFVMLVRFTEPTSSIFGAETAAPTFFSIAKDVLNYWAIPPSSN